MTQVLKLTTTAALPAATTRSVISTKLHPTEEIKQKKKKKRKKKKKKKKKKNKKKKKKKKMTSTYWNRWHTIGIPIILSLIHI